MQMLQLGELLQQLTSTLHLSDAGGGGKRGMINQPPGLGQPEARARIHCIECRFLKGPMSAAVGTCC
jgi:hypothetical protein